MKWYRTMILFVTHFDQQSQSVHCPVHLQLLCFLLDAFFEWQVCSIIVPFTFTEPIPVLMNLDLNSRMNRAGSTHCYCGTKSTSKLACRTSLDFFKTTHTSPALHTCIFNMTRWFFSPLKLGHKLDNTQMSFPSLVKGGECKHSVLYDSGSQPVVSYILPIMLSKNVA